MMNRTAEVWLFGYGSLMWRPGFQFHKSRSARLAGYTRRFWQGSHDHRGLPDAPGRVVTLVPEPGANCDGIAFLITADVAEKVFLELDHREKNGYRRLSIDLLLDDGRTVPGLVYIASESNHAFLGPAPVEQMAAQIAVSTGPSGSNAEYLFKLADALRTQGVEDAHVFELERAVRIAQQPVAR